MKMYVVHDRPEDYPDRVVVRECRIFDGKVYTAADLYMWSGSAQGIHDYFSYLVWVPREPDDPPHILGTYM